MNKHKLKKMNVDTGMSSEKLHLFSCGFILFQ